MDLNHFFTQVEENSTINFTSTLKANAPVPTVLNESELLDPGYNFDFTNVVDDGLVYMRGGEVYHRPYGWNRIALNVNGKYADDEWLGPIGVRQESTDEEWPVSYHGTGEDGAKGIAEKGYLLSRCRRFRYGKGIYSSPSIKVAEEYAAGFCMNNCEYLVVMQNRINKEGLLKIPAEKNGRDGDYWVQPNENYVRPYGICLKRIDVMKQ